MGHIILDVSIFDAVAIFPRVEAVSAGNTLKGSQQ